MRIRLQLLANQNWRSNGCYQSLVCAPGSGYENDKDQRITWQSRSQSPQSSVGEIVGSGKKPKRMHGLHRITLLSDPVH